MINSVYLKDQAYIDTLRVIENKLGEWLDQIQGEIRKAVSQGNFAVKLFSNNYQIPQDKEKHYAIAFWFRSKGYWTSIGEDSLMIGWNNIDDGKGLREASSL